jgi:class 3 adenylate cyclase
MTAPQPRHTPKLDETDWIRAGIVGGTVALVLFALTAIRWEKLMTSAMPGIGDLSFAMPSLDRTALVILAPVTGALVAAVLHPMALWTALALIAAAMTGVGFSYYSYKAISLWWFLPIIGVLTSGGVVFHLKEVLRRTGRASLRAALSSFLPQVVVEKVVNEPSLLVAGDRQSTGTIVVVELGSFTALAVKQNPVEVREAVKAIHDLLRQMVSAFGGVMCSGHRHGFVLAFGDLFLKDGYLARHAEAALQCAMTVQKACAERSSRMAATNQLVTALKIGVASGRINIGNIGDDGNVVPLFFGEPMEVARNLQRSCDSNRILISSITKDLLGKPISDSDWLTKRMVNGATETEELTDAYEIDPLRDEPDLKKRVMEAIRASQKRERKDERWPVKWPERVRILTSVGEGMLLNISRHGLGLRLPQGMGVGTTVRVSFVPVDEGLNQRLTQRGIGWVTAEVRWTSTGKEGNAHGCIYKNLPAADKEFLFLCLLDSQEARQHLKIG